jgi:hypothetical protein
MSLRIVVYAEGVGELGGDVRPLPAPREPLLEEHLGAAHELVRRCVTRERPQLPDSAIVFVSPLRDSGGRRLRGSDLCDKQKLRRALAWLPNKRRPDLAVVFVDCDGDDERRRLLLEHLDEVILPAAIGVPKQEFESWLIADHRAVVRTLQPAPAQPANVETLRRTEAKMYLTKWTADSSLANAPHDVRITLARTCDLAVLDQLAAFQAFCEDLRAKLAAI